MKRVPLPRYSVSVVLPNTTCQSLIGRSISCPVSFSVSPLLCTALFGDRDDFWWLVQEALRSWTLCRRNDSGSARQIQGSVDPRVNRSKCQWSQGSIGLVRARLGLGLSTLGSMAAWIHWTLDLLTWTQCHHKWHDIEFTVFLTHDIGRSHDTWQMTLNSEFSWPMTLEEPWHLSNDMTLNSVFLTLDFGGTMTHGECHVIEFTVFLTYDIGGTMTHGECHVIEFTVFLTHDIGRAMTRDIEFRVFLTHDIGRSHCMWQMIWNWINCFPYSWQGDMTHGEWHDIEFTVSLTHDIGRSHDTRRMSWHWINSFLHTWHWKSFDTWWITLNSVFLTCDTGGAMTRDEWCDD